VPTGPANNLRTLDPESFTDAHASEEGDWLMHVVATAALRPEGTWHETALPCRRRLRSGKSAPDGDVLGFSSVGRQL